MQAVWLPLRAEKLATLRDVVAVLELRIGIETEAAGLAAQRRTARDLTGLREALDQFERSVRAGRDAIDPDYRFHLEHRARHAQPALRRDHRHARRRPSFRGRAKAPAVSKAERRAYLLKVNAEHESILGAIAAEDADGARAAMRTHLANSRERRRREAAAAGNGH